MTRLYLASAVLWMMWTATASGDLVASYTFQNTLTSEYGSAPALTASNPLTLNGFQTATVYGQSRSVYRLDGNNNNTQNAGVTLDTTGLISSANYSVELVFRYTQALGGYRKLLDFNDRTQDNGLYVTPSTNTLSLIGGGAMGSTPILLNNFYHLVLTNASATNQVRAYVDGVSQFTVISNVPDISNSNDLLRFFMDDLATNGVEYSDVTVALIRLYDNVLAPADVAQKAINPFTIVPEVSAGMQVGAVACGIALCLVGRFARRHLLKA